VGYRSEWIGHTGLVSRHSEVALHAIDRAVTDRVSSVLIAGVENGGAVEIWQRVLPDGVVVGLDRDPRCADVGVPVVVCDVLDEGSVRGALSGQWFDLIVDSTRAGSPWLWPYLRTGGRLILEDAPVDLVDDLTAAVSRDRETWLPVEEIMHVSVFPRVTVVEKRSPRVVPYLDIMVGNFADVTGERDLLDRGVRWVVA
jgi:hypothetical protein